MEADAGNSVTKTSFVYSEHISEFVKSVADFYITKQFWDIIFVCKQNIRVHAHKTVLASYSKFLSEVIRLNSQDVTYISLPDTEYEKIKLLLAVLYEGAVQLSHKELEVLKDLCAYLYIDMNNINIQEVNTENNSGNFENENLNISAKENIVNNQTHKQTPDEKNDETVLDCTSTSEFDPSKLPWCLYSHHFKTDQNSLSTEQFKILENAYKEHIFPNEKVRQKLARQLGMASHQVTKWFTLKMTGQKVVGKKKDLKTLSNDPRNKLLEKAYSTNKYPNVGEFYRLRRDLSLPAVVLKNWYSRRRQEEKQLEIKYLLREHEETLEMTLKDRRFPNAEVREELAKEIGVSFKQVTEWFVMRVRNKQSDSNNVTKDHDVESSDKKAARDIRYELLEEIYKTNQNLDCKETSKDLALSLRDVMYWLSLKQDKEKRDMMKLAKASDDQKKNADNYSEADTSSGDDNDDKGVECKDYSPHESLSSCASAINELDSGAAVDIKVEPFVETIIKEESDENMIIEEEAMSEDESAAECNIDPDLLVTDTLDTESGNNDSDAVMQELSEEQLKVLESVSKGHVYPNLKIRYQLSCQLKMPMREVTKWFNMKLMSERNVTNPSNLEEFVNDPRIKILEELYSTKKNPRRKDLRKISQDLSVSTHIVRQWFNEKSQDEQILAKCQNEEIFDRMLEKHKFPNAKVRRMLARKLGMPFKHVTKYFVMKVCNGRSVAGGSFVGLRQFRNDPRNELLENMFKTKKNPKVKQVSMDLALPISFVTDWFVQRQDKENKYIIAEMETLTKNAESSETGTTNEDNSNCVHFLLTENGDILPREPPVSCTSADSMLESGNFTAVNIKEEAIIEDEHAECSIEPDPLSTDKFNIQS